MNDNKLIAEFMGWNTTDCDEVFTEPAGMMERYTTAEMEFQTSWDWLMPVVHEIDKICRENLGLNHNLHIGDNRAEVYLQVVEFIEDYNDER